MSPDANVARLRANRQGEIDSLALYVATAAHEPDTGLAEVCRQLAAAEERRADLWREELGIDPDDPGGSPRAAALGLRACARWG